MAKYEVKFNDANTNAAVFRKAESDLRGYMNAVKTAAYNLNTNDNSLLGRPQADILSQLKNLERVCDKLTAEANALPQIMEIYGKSERNIFSFICDNALVKGALSFIAGFWNAANSWTGAVVGWLASLLTIAKPQPVSPEATPVKVPGTTPLGKLVSDAGNTSTGANVDEAGAPQKSNVNLSSRAEKTNYAASSLVKGGIFNSGYDYGTVGNLATERNGHGHTGIDIYGDANTKIYTGAQVVYPFDVPAKVVYKDQSWFGTTVMAEVEIDGQKYTIAFGHLHDKTNLDAITKDTVLGTVGNTGASGGAYHLHFEVRKGAYTSWNSAELVDPVEFIASNAS